jgi:hypothetical protein
LFEAGVAGSGDREGVSMSHSNVSRCTPLSAAGGSGTSVTNLKTLVSTTIWAGGKGTTIEMACKSGPNSTSVRPERR